MNSSPSSFLIWSCVLPTRPLRKLKPRQMRRWVAAVHREDEYSRNAVSSSEDHRLFDITHHEIDGSIKGTTITASDRVTFRPLVAGRVLSFNLYRTLRVSRVQDGEGKDLGFIQESK